jgi:hypothetical protein
MALGSLQFSAALVGCLLPINLLVSGAGLEASRLELRESADRVTQAEDGRIQLRCGAVTRGTASDPHIREIVFRFDLRDMLYQKFTRRSAGWAEEIRPSPLGASDVISSTKITILDSGIISDTRYSFDRMTGDYEQILMLRGFSDSAVERASRTISAKCLPEKWQGFSSPPAAVLF